MRKAQLAENMLTYWMVLIAFAIIAIIFLTIFSPKTEKTEIINALGINNVGLVLLDYLRTPVEDGDVADLIVKSYYNDDFDDVEKKTKEILGSLYSDDFDTWNLGVIKLPEDKLITIINKDDRVTRAMEADVIIPLDEKSSLKIRLVKGKLLSFVR